MAGHTRELSQAIRYHARLFWGAVGSLGSDKAKFIVVQLNACICHGCAHMLAMVQFDGLGKGVLYRATVVANQRLCNTFGTWYTVMMLNLLLICGFAMPVISVCSGGLQRWSAEILNEQFCAHAAMLCNSFSLVIPSAGG